MAALRMSMSLDVALIYYLSKLVNFSASPFLYAFIMVNLSDVAQSVTCNNVKKQIESVYPLGSNGNWEELNSLATMIAIFPTSLAGTCLCSCILVLLPYPQSQALTELSCSPYLRFGM